MSRTMHFTPLLVLSLALITCGALAPPSAGARDVWKNVVTQHITPRRLTVTGQGEVKIIPDKAEITIGVVTEDPSSKSAANANAAASEKVQSAMILAGVQKRDIQTINYSVQPIYGPEQTGPDGVRRPPTIVDYRVANQVRITARDLARLSDVIDAATVAGSNTIDGIVFAREDQAAAENEALKRAVRNARSKADLIAATAGVRIVGVFELNEGQVQRPIPMTYSRAAMASTPINSGELSVSATVTIVYEMSSTMKGGRRPP